MDPVQLHVDLDQAKTDFDATKSALQLDETIDDSRMLHIGIIGCGRIGHTHAKNITNNIKDAMLVCVSDVFESAARKLAKAYKVPMACTDPLDLINNPAVQAVIVCSPTDTHAEIIKAAAVARKDVFCEKPVDKNLAVIDELTKVINDTGIKFFLGFQRRFDRHFHRAKHGLDSGYIGNPVKLLLTSRDPSPPPVGYLKQSGGLFLDMSSHDFDMARFLMGSDIVEVNASAMAVDPEIAAIGDVDHTICTVRFENGCIGTIDNSRSCALGYDQRAEFFGSKGSITVENVCPNMCSYTNEEGHHSDKPLTFFMDRYAEAYSEEMKAFVDVCISDKPVPVGIEDGRKTVLYAAAANLSIKERRTVKVSEVDKPVDHSGDAKARY